MVTNARYGPKGTQEEAELNISISTHFQLDSIRSNLHEAVGAETRITPRQGSLVLGLLAIYLGCMYAGGINPALANFNSTGLDTTDPTRFP